MAKVAQGFLPLNWEVIEQSSDLARLRMVLRGLDDEELMQALEKERKQRRDDYPVRVCWNCLLAGLVLQHAKVAGLLRELGRNPSLRQVVGMDPHKGEKAVPTKDAMSRFTQKLLKPEHAQRVEAVVQGLQERLRQRLPDLGRHLAVDATALRTWARGRRDPAQSTDPEAGWGKKTRRWKDKEGQVHEEVTKWFGYKLFLLVDTRYEIPLEWSLHPAHVSDNQPVEELLEGLKKKHPEMKVETLAGDKAFDDGPLIRRIHEGFGIRAVFALRDTAQDGEDGEALPGARNILLGKDGLVYCYHQEGAQILRQPMVYWGFDQGRTCQKWRCPAAVSGQTCAERAACSPTPYGRSVRVKCQTDWRRFGPMPHGTVQRRQRYNGRTAVERVNSRLKTGLTLDDLHVRGQARIGLRTNLALIVLLAMAQGHLENKAKAWRSLTRLARSTEPLPTGTRRTRQSMNAGEQSTPPPPRSHVSRPGPTLVQRPPQLSLSSPAPFNTPISRQA